MSHMFVGSNLYRLREHTIRSVKVVESLLLAEKFLKNLL